MQGSVQMNEKINAIKEFESYLMPTFEACLFETFDIET